jgi:hypothetical protein
MRLDAHKSRLVLLAWFAACFAFSAIANLALLGGLLGLVAMLFPRQACPGRPAVRLSQPPPYALAILLLTWAHARISSSTFDPDLRAYAALALRTTLIAFSTFAVLDSRRFARG